MNLLLVSTTRHPGRNVYSDSKLALCLSRSQSVVTDLLLMKRESSDCIGEEFTCMLSLYNSELA